MTYRVKVYKDCEVDDYEKGCIGEPQCFGCIITEDFKTSEKILYFLEQFGEHLIILEDQISVSQLENENGHKAFNNEIEIWKEGRKKLWNATYNIFITEFKEKDLDNEYLKKLFPTIEVY